MASRLLCVLICLSPALIASAAPPPPSTHPAGGPSLKKPSELCDPSHPVLSRVLQPDRFPSGQFATPEWLAVLRACGLKAALDHATFLQAAHGIAERAHALSSSTPAPDLASAPAALSCCVLAAPRQLLSTAGQEIWDAACCLAEHLGERNEESGALLQGGDASREFMSTLREVGTEDVGIDVFGAENAPRTRAFLEDIFDEGRRSEGAAGKQAGNELALTFILNLSPLQIHFVPSAVFVPAAATWGHALARYSDCLVPKDWPLAWSCLPVIHSDAHLPVATAWSALRLNSPPKFDSIQQHLARVRQKKTDYAARGVPHSPTPTAVHARPSSSTCL
jgi:hypothetical protein